MLITAQFPTDLPHEVIAQTLAYIGGRIVDHVPFDAPVRKVSRKARTAKPAADYQDIIVRHKETGEVIREIDGVTVDKLIRKMEGARNRAANFDGRTKSHFPDFPAMAKFRPDTAAQEYIEQFCSGLSHVKAEYRNGVTA